MEKIDVSSYHYISKATTMDSAIRRRLSKAVEPPPQAKHKKRLHIAATKNSTSLMVFISSFKPNISKQQASKITERWKASLRHHALDLCAVYFDIRILLPIARAW